MRNYIYFDNAASSPKPKEVVEVIADFYLNEYAPVHRGLYKPSERATERYEEVRAQVAAFLNARDAQEIIFTKGATESINCVASTWAMRTITKGDEILLTHMEHHANLLPWQRVAEQTGALLKFIPVLEDGTLDYSKLPELITQRTKLVSVVHVSNGLGTHNDITVIAQHAKNVGAKLLVDACQSVPHQKIDVQKMGCDFLVFSGHKMLAPTGVGVLYINKELLDHMPPYQLGGGMVHTAHWTTATWLPAPLKYEAGTPPIAQVIGLGAAIEYLEGIDRTALQQREAQMCSAVIDGLLSLKGVRIFGPVEQLKKQGHLVTFSIDGIHPHDVAAFLDSKYICARAGDFCLQPMWRMWGLSGAVRVSFYVQNDIEQVDVFLKAMQELAS